MPDDENDLRLLKGVLDRNLGVVEAALEAGANVDGSPEQPFTPIAAAAMATLFLMVSFLLEQGADPDRPVRVELRCPRSGRTTIPGERALHIAARGRNVAIVRLLLKRSSADPDATDNEGQTPLVSTLFRRHCPVGVVRLLLEAGADAALADEHGFAPLHAVAYNGHIALIDMLYSEAPSVLNRSTANGVTPLYGACARGDESMVSKLLSLGAMQRMPSNKLDKFPLSIAVMEGFVGVVRVLINEGGIRAIGAEMALAQSLGMAVRTRKAKILRFLLAAEGEEKRSECANTSFGANRLLHLGAGFFFPAEVSILLDAGADEAVRDSEGRTPRDMIGLHHHLEDKPHKIDLGGAVAMSRMLQRGPAYRARTWAWPSDEEPDDAGGCDDGNTAAAAAAAAAAVDGAAAQSSPPDVEDTPRG